MRYAIIPIALALSGCASLNPPQRPEIVNNWRAQVTDDDRARLREWRSGLARALTRARAAGHGAKIDAEGALLLPDAGLMGPIPAGDYRCRIIKLGAKGEGLLDYIAYPAFACRVSPQGQVQRFAKLTGSQRPVGTIYPADAMRSVFLGTLVLGDEARMMRYANDPDRDVVGWVERIAPEKWRIVFPAPRFESLTDVMELVPA